MTDKIVKRIITSVDNLNESKDKCLQCGSKNLHLEPMFGEGAKLICDNCGYERYVLD